MSVSIIIEDERMMKLKIITKSNFDLELFTETVVAENVSKGYGKELMEAWSDVFRKGHHDTYLALVEDDYVLYDGYKELMG